MLPMSYFSCGMKGWIKHQLIVHCKLIVLVYHYESHNVIYVHWMIFFVNSTRKIVITITTSNYHYSTRISRRCLKMKQQLKDNKKFKKWPEEVRIAHSCITFSFLFPATPPLLKPLRSFVVSAVFCFFKPFLP